MTEDDIETALVTWLNVQTGYTTIRAYQDGPRPALPYLTTHLTNVREVREHPQTIAYHETANVNTSGEQEVVAIPVIEYEWEFSLTCYGAQPATPLREVKSLSQVTQRMEPMFPALTIFDTKHVNLVPEYVQNAWEPRAKMRTMIRGLIGADQALDTGTGYLIDPTTGYVVDITTGFDPADDFADNFTRDC